MDFLLGAYPVRLLGWHGPARRMANVWAIAFREQSRMPTDGDLDRYRDRMKAYAKQPLPWHRRLRYQVGSLLCGRRPFAPHLERESWSMECRGRAAA